jgi:hypothetical protein
MSTIYHIEVGDKDFTPTEEQLKEVVNEFLTKDIPAYGHKIRISEVYTGLVGERLIIEAGDKDWDPTQEELDALVKKFKDAQLVDGSVVATRRGVKLHTVTALVVPTIGLTGGEVTE